jgi:hypothetical protein
MATNNGVLASWQLIEAAGFEPRAKTDDEIETAIRVWSALLADIDDRRLAELTIAWLRSPEARFGKWPTPGGLLSSIENPETIDDSDEAWSEALALIALTGADGAPETAEALETLRGKLRARYIAARAAKDTDKMRRIHANAERLPRADAERTAAILAAVRSVGGWLRLGRADDAALVSHRAAFRKTYQAFRKRTAITGTERAIAALLDAPAASSLPALLPLVRG